MDAPILSIDLIAESPLRNGRPCVAGTSLEVSTIAIVKVVHGLSVDEIADNYDLSLAQVYAALAYYYDNKASIDSSIAEREALAEKMREERVGSRRPSLLG